MESEEAAMCMARDVSMYVHLTFTVINVIAQALMAVRKSTDCIQSQSKSALSAFQGAGLGVQILVHA